jgi:hypothetical protein
MGRFEGALRRENRPLHGLTGSGMLAGVAYHSGAEEIQTEEAFRCALQ